MVPDCIRIRYVFLNNTNLNGIRLSSLQLKMKKFVIFFSNFSFIRLRLVAMTLKYIDINKTRRKMKR